MAKCSQCDEPETEVNRLVIHRKGEEPQEAHLCLFHLLFLVKEIPPNVEWHTAEIIGDVQYIHHYVS